MAMCLQSIALIAAVNLPLTANGTVIAAWSTGSSSPGEWRDPASGRGAPVSQALVLQRGKVEHQISGAVAVLIRLGEEEAESKGASLH